MQIEQVSDRITQCLKQIILQEAIRIVFVVQFHHFASLHEESILIAACRSSSMSTFFRIRFLSHKSLLTLDETLCAHIEVNLDDRDEELSECLKTPTQDVVKDELSCICLCRPFGQTRNDWSQNLFVELKCESIEAFNEQRSANFVFNGQTIHLLEEHHEFSLVF